MKLALSNIALPEGVDSATWKDLASGGLEGVEVALTRVAPWAQLDAATVTSYRLHLSDAGLSIPSLQAILYGITDAQLLMGDTQFHVMEAHLRRVARLGHLLGARAAVFGAPKHRLKGGLSGEAAIALGIKRLSRLADVMFEEGGMIIALEPAPEGYGGDFLTTVSEVAAVVRAAAHPGLKINLDTGCAQMAGEAFTSAVRYAGSDAAHVQVSEPGLCGFSEPQVEHQKAAHALRQGQYDGWLSIEMLENAHAPIAACLQAIAYVRKIYITQ